MVSGEKIDILSTSCSNCRPKRDRRTCVFACAGLLCHHRLGHVWDWCFPTSLCTGIVYGTVQLVSFTVLARFLAHLPCCRTESCRPVAEQGLSRRPLLATACSESSRERFLHIVLCGSVCMIGERVPDLLSSAKKPVSVDWRLFYADDFSSSYSAATPRSSKTNDSSAPLERCQCSVLMIFSPSCPFSVKLSPVYSALARRFPTLPFLAINADLNSR